MPFFTDIPEKNFYEKRIECLENMLAIQRSLLRAENEYVNVSLIEGKTHENALRRLETHQKAYNTLYIKCENILKE